MKNEDAEAKARKEKVYAEVMAAQAESKAIYAVAWQDAQRRMREQEAEEVRQAELRAQDSSSPLIVLSIRSCRML